MRGESERWWAVPEAERHRVLGATYATLRSMGSQRESAMQRWLQLFIGVEVAGLGPRAYNRKQSGAASYMTFNEAANAVNSMVARVTKSRPKPMYMTDGADWAMRKRAELRTQYMEGQFAKLKYYQHATDAFRDACITGTGAIKVYVDEHGDMQLERVFPWEMLLDPIEARYGSPRTLMQFRYVDRDVLAAAFPDHEKEIVESQRAAYEQDQMIPTAYMYHADLLLTVEAWHVPSGAGADDGRHSLVIDSATLLDEPWERSGFPFAFIRYERDPQDFWGLGLCERVVGMQTFVNRMSRDIEAALRLFARPRVFLERSSKVVKSHFTSDVGTIVEYTGTPPVMSVPPGMPPEAYKFMEYVRSRIYEQQGISQSLAEGKFPAGLRSGRAIRLASDLEAERHLEIGRNWEQLALDVSDLVDEVAADARSGRSAKALRVSVSAGPGKLRWLNWSDVELDEEEYRKVVYPVSALANTPTARLEQVEEMMSAGLVQDPSEALELLDWPDVQAWKRRKLAPRDLVEQQLAAMIDPTADGVYVPPEPTQDLQLALRVSVEVYQQARLDGVPEDRLDLIRRYMSDVAALVQMAAPPPGAPPPGPAAAGPAEMPTGPVAGGAPMNGAGLS